jgi:hypothetical protein
LPTAFRIVALGENQILNQQSDLIAKMRRHSSIDVVIPQACAHRPNRRSTSEGLTMVIGDWQLTIHD